MAAAPTAMNAPRITSARTMPMVSTFCWYSRGTAKVDMMITKTNRLSTLRAFSVTYPAKYSPPYVGPQTANTTTPNTTARPMNTADQKPDSRNVGACGLRTCA